MKCKVPSHVPVPFSHLRPACAFCHRVGTQKDVCFEVAGVKIATLSAIACSVFDYKQSRLLC